MTLLTIFTTPKAFTNPHTALIQMNALCSWQALESEVEILVLGDDEGVDQAAAAVNAQHIPGLRRNAEGTPLISDIFAQARSHANSPLLAYVNADILLMPDILSAAKAALAQFDKFLLIGQRWDLDVTEPLDFSGDWVKALRERAVRDGKLHPPAGSDYFIFPKDGFREMPEFAIGRAGWDNWMIFQSRFLSWPTIDCTRDVMIVHQNHDYSHLPGGQPHYKLPETFTNIRLAGGRWVTRFMLNDCNYSLVNGTAQKLKLKGKRLLREAEIFPAAALKSKPLGSAFYWLFHPRWAYNEWRRELASKGGK